MRFAILRKTLTRSTRWVTAHTGTEFLFGTLAAWYIVAWCHQLTALFGLSLTTFTAVAVALALAVELAWRRPAHAGTQPEMTPLAACWLVPVVWCAGFPWLMETALNFVGRFGIEALEAPAQRLPLLFGIACAALAPPIYALTRLPIQLQRLRRHHIPDKSNQPAILVRYVAGIACGIALNVLLLAPLFGLDLLAYAAAIGTAGLCGYVWKRAGAAPSEKTFSDTAPQPQHRRTLRAAFDSIFTAIVILALGGLSAIAMRMTHQLNSAAGYLVWAEWAALLAGVAAGLFWSHRGRSTGVSRWCFATLIAAAWCGLLPLLFSWHVDGLLLVNSYVSPVWLQVMLRCLVVLTMLAPFGFAWGTIAGSGGDGDGSVGAFPQISVFSFVAGLLAVRWLLVSRWPLEDILTTASIALAVVTVLRWMAATRRLPRGWLVRSCVTALVCIAAIAPVVRHRYNPAQAARTLFSTQVFLSKRGGMSGPMLVHVDEGRLVAQREGEHGTYTVWKMRGVQLQVREGGIPKAIVSNDTRVCPQFSADIMQGALPILLHEEPRRVLLLGLQGGITLDTCFHFPLEHVTCVEGDPELIRLVDDVLLTEEKRDLLHSDRVRMLTLDPALALAADDEQYDVIVSCPDQSALAQSASCYTVEFYRNASRRLAADGIFCQRFQYVDYGPEPLRTVTATLRQAFGAVTVVETAAGELALLGTNSSKGFLREGFAERLQADHVRNVLAQAGWDWAVPLNLSAYNDETLAEFAEEGNARANTSANGRLAFRLPLEVMRWGVKWQEINEVLAARTGSFLKWGGDTDASRDALLRLEEISGQRNLILQYPDQKWAYRKTLRERMSTKSRTTIQQVKGEGPQRVMHPDDRRRKDYLKALGEAVKNPDAEHIDRVAEFSQPYDPFVSFFHHDEIVRLYDRAEHPDPAAELRHRLHLVYYSDPRDNSVRNIVGALNLLVEHPEAVAGDVERRDHLDALLQMLRSRWNARSAGVPVSKSIALTDVAESVAAVSAAFDTLEEIYAAADRDGKRPPLRDVDWQSRRRVLERTLLRPLRTYRAQLLSQQAIPKRATEEAANAN